MACKTKARIYLIHSIIIHLMIHLMIIHLMYCQLTDDVQCHCDIVVLAGYLWLVRLWMAVINMYISEDMFLDHNDWSLYY